MAIQHVARSPLLDEALAHGGPIIVFDNVRLAFDEKVILRDVSFTLQTGHTKIFLGASGAGKSTILRLMLGLLKPDGGVIFVNGERVDDMTEDELMKVRADLGMVFQEGALFDSLTVRENVGYKLFEETDTGRSTRPNAPRRGSARVRRPGGVHRPDAVGALGRAAPPRRDRAGDGRQAAHPALRRADDRARSDHRADRRRRDHQAARPRGRQLDPRHAPAARRVLRRRAHGAPRGRQARVRARPTARKADEAEFIMLKDGRIALRGQRHPSCARRRRRTRYIEAFLCRRKDC